MSLWLTVTWNTHVMDLKGFQKSRKLPIFITSGINPTKHPMIYLAYKAKFCEIFLKIKFYHQLLHEGLKNDSVEAMPHHKYKMVATKILVPHYLYMCDLILAIQKL